MSSVPRRLVIGCGWWDRRVFHAANGLAYKDIIMSIWIIAWDVFPIGSLEEPVIVRQPSAAEPPSQESKYSTDTVKAVVFF